MWVHFALSAEAVPISSALFMVLLIPIVETPPELTWMAVFVPGTRLLVQNVVDFYVSGNYHQCRPTDVSLEPQSRLFRMRCMFFFHCQDLFMCSLRKKYLFLLLPFCQSFSVEAPYILHALPSQYL